MSGWFIRSAGSLLLVMVSLTAVGGEAYKPFVLAAPAGETVSSATQSVIAKFRAAGPDVVGQYDPYGEGTATIINI